jgi:molybdate transport system substrate-binding protein
MPSRFRVLRFGIRSKRLLSSGVLALGMGLGVLPTTEPAHAAEVKILVGNAFKPVLESVRQQFEKGTASTLTVTVYSTTTMNDLLNRAGEFDLAIMPQAAADDAVKRGQLVVNTKIELARSGIGVIVRAGAAKPDVSSTDAFKQMLLTSKSIAYIERAPTGIYLKELFANLGLADQLLTKTRFVSAVAKAVASGDAEIGMTQISEVLGADGVELAGPLPSEIQRYLVLSAGVGAAAKNPHGARQLLDFLASSVVADVIKTKGLETVPNH